MEPSAILDYVGSVFRPFRTLHPITYEHTKFGEDIFSDGGDMPQNGIQKTPPGSGILLPVQTLTPSLMRGSSYVSSRKISAKSCDRLQSYIDFAILLFVAHFGPLSPPPLWGISIPVYDNVPWTPVVFTPNSILIRSAVLAQ